MVRFVEVFPDPRIVQPLAAQLAGYQPAPQSSIAATKRRLQPAVTGEPPVPPRNRRGARGNQGPVIQSSIAATEHRVVLMPRGKERAPVANRRAGFQPAPQGTAA